MEDCEVKVTSHVDKRTPADIIDLCWGAECETHGPLLNGDWFDWFTVQAAADAHLRGEA